MFCLCSLPSITVSKELVLISMFSLLPLGFVVLNNVSSILSIILALFPMEYFWWLPGPLGLVFILHCNDTACSVSLSYFTWQN